MLIQRVFAERGLGRERWATFAHGGEPMGAIGVPDGGHWDEIEGTLFVDGPGWVDAPTALRLAREGTFGLTWCPTLPRDAVTAEPSPMAVEMAGRIEAA